MNLFDGVTDSTKYLQLKIKAILIIAEWNEPFTIV